MQLSIFTKEILSQSIEENGVDIDIDLTNDNLQLLEKLANSNNTSVSVVLSYLLILSIIDIEREKEENYIYDDVISIFEFQDNLKKYFKCKKLLIIDQSLNKFEFNQI